MQYGTSRAGHRQVIASVCLMVAVQVIPPTNAYSAELHRSQPVRYAVPHGMSVKSYAKTWYKLKGATDRQWKCLEILWTNESHWNYKARNHRGGALGIPQALPASKMAVINKDYKTNPATQIQWGLKYIKSRYANNACYALKHQTRRGWY